MTEALKKRKAPTPTIDSAFRKASGYVPPTQRETSSWARSTRFATKVTSLESEEERSSVAVDLEMYNDETYEILLWNGGLMAVCFAATYAFYTQDVAISYAVGAFGGLVYLRLLKKSIEGIGGGGGLSSIVAQPRLLVPIILVLLFNRWNALASDQTGIHVELLPMLVGFFTYKAAVIGRQSLRLFQDVLRGIKGDMHE